MNNGSRVESNKPYIHVALGFAIKAKLGMEIKSGYFNYNQRREMIATRPFILPAYTDTRERNGRELVIYLMCKSPKDLFHLSFLQAVSGCVTMNPSIPSSKQELLTRSVCQYQIWYCCHPLTTMRSTWR